jgi:hypothetical protein
MPGINESRRPSKPPTKETCFFSLFYIKSILHLLCIMRKLCGVKPKVYKQNYLIDRAMDIFERGRIQSKMWNCLFKFLSFGFWFSPEIVCRESWSNSRLDSRTTGQAFLGSSWRPSHKWVKGAVIITQSSDLYIFPVLNKKRHLPYRPTSPAYALTL